jgi:hypothetical protein
MPNVVSLQTRRQYVRNPSTQAAFAPPWVGQALRTAEGEVAATRDALQEVIFALHIHNAQSLTMIEAIGHPSRREGLRTQSQAITSLLDVAWNRVREL